MSVRLQADADLNHVIVKATLRREPSIDFQTAHAAGLVGLRDPTKTACPCCDRGSAPHLDGQRGRGMAQQNPGAALVVSCTCRRCRLWEAPDACR